MKEKLLIIVGVAFPDVDSAYSALPQKKLTQHRCGPLSGSQAVCALTFRNSVFPGTVTSIAPLQNLTALVKRLLFDIILFYMYVFCCIECHFTAHKSNKSLTVSLSHI